MTEDEWNSGFTRCFGMRLGGDAMLEWDDRGERVLDDTFLLLFNGDVSTIPFKLPLSKPEVAWEPILSTSDPDLGPGGDLRPGGTRIPLEGRSVTVLRRIDGESE
jgi:isoamylase